MRASRRVLVRSSGGSGTATMGCRSSCWCPKPEAAETSTAPVLRCRHGKGEFDEGRAAHQRAAHSGMESVTGMRTVRLHVQYTSSGDTWTRVQPPTPSVPDQSTSAGGRHSQKPHRV